MSSKSQQAYKRGDKKAAGELSAQAKKQYAIAEQYNAKAAEYVFIENNRDSDDNDIDLHGLYVKEAEYILKQRIISGIRKNQSTLDCIVGKGLHSKNGIAKLKPAVEELCKESNMRTWIDPKNSGVLHIDIKNAKIPQSWYNVNPDGIGAMDDNYYAYHPEEQGNNSNYAQNTGSGSQYYNQQPQQQNYHHQQQQHQHQQNQQNNQNNQNEQCAGVLLSIFGIIIKQFCR